MVVNFIKTMMLRFNHCGELQVLRSIDERLCGNLIRNPRNVLLILPMLSSCKTVYL